MQVFVCILTDDVSMTNDPSTQNRHTVERHDHEDQHPKHACQLQAFPQLPLIISSKHHKGMLKGIQRAAAGFGLQDIHQAYA